MGRYVTLAAGSGGLEGIDGDLDPKRQADAEREADQRIDIAFSIYDRTGWSPKSQPPEIGFIAQKLAAAEYIQRSFQAASQSQEIPPSVVDLRTRAKEAIDEAKARGWLMGVDNRRVLPLGGKSTSMMVELGVELDDAGLGGGFSTNRPPLSPRGPF